MPNTKTSLLIVDDEPSIRMSLSYVLGEIGYRVRTAEDGLSALGELRREVPDLLLSDLNMPRMSGFELLSVVRRRFPAMQTIAMSGAFSGDEVPSGVAADGFYQKGSSMGCLLRLMDALPRPDRVIDNHTTATEPIRVQQGSHGVMDGASVTIACPECLRSFSHACGESNGEMRAVHCMHCDGLIHYALVEPVLEQAWQARDEKRNRFEATLRSADATSSFY